MTLDIDSRELLADEIEVVAGGLKEKQEAQAKAQDLQNQAGSSGWAGKGFGGANALK